ncbi:hypothetical protein MJC1_01709 [Methylocystis sp. MJC1]|nr:hypothetical protein MJC1_01709 [Methylocystis sp. MJC1]
MCEVKNNAKTKADQLIEAINKLTSAVQGILSIES